MTIATPLDIDTKVKSRRAAIGHHASIFTDVFEEDTNIAIWRRDLSAEVKLNVSELIALQTHLEIGLVAKPQDVFAKLVAAESKLENAQALLEDISELTDMFCLLFDLKQAGLRLTILDRAMCPRFHVDRVPCRLVSTYHSASSEWLPHDVIDRSKLGRGNNGLADEESGLYPSTQDIKQLDVGDVAILKGELWEGNDNAGLVHRSPQVPLGEKRLLFTLDFAAY